MKTVAFIPVRLNSERVEQKNLRLLGGRALLCYMAESLAAAKNIDEVYLYCSDERVKEHLPETPKFPPQTLTESKKTKT